MINVLHDSFISLIRWIKGEYNLPSKEKVLFLGDFDMKF